MAKFAIVAVVVLAAACGRQEGSAKTSAMRLLGRPVACDGTDDDGYLCFDGIGHAVWCPPQKDKPCEIVKVPGIPQCAEAASP